MFTSFFFLLASSSQVLTKYTYIFLFSFLNWNFEPPFKSLSWKLYGLNKIFGSWDMWEEDFQNTQPYIH